MKYKREEMFDLNEENVKNIFKYCMATTRTPKENIRSYTFFSEKCQVNIQKMPFDIARLQEMEGAINYMLGQLLSVHSNDILMPLNEGFRKYTDKNWTENRVALFSLYYLGVSACRLPEFKPSTYGKDEFISPINRSVFLEPTLSPNDPNFEKWCKENDVIE